jgi:F0F1-type ATP synthase delta subunit
MNGSENLLAKKYATAFLNLYLDTISLDDYYTLKTAADFFKENYKFFFLLSTPTISISEKQNCLDSLVKQLSIPHSLTKLIELVLKHQRLFLLPAIFKQLVLGYAQRKKIAQFLFFSSPMLNTTQLEIVRNFLAKKTNHTIMYKQVRHKQH